MISQPLKDILSDEPPRADGKALVYPTVFVTQDDAVDCALDETGWELGPPTVAETAALKESAQRAARIDGGDFRRSQEPAGFYRNRDGCRVLAIKSGARCSEQHRKTLKKSFCGHHWCSVCHGYVDPNTLVLLGAKPNVTVWCNRKTAPRENYDLFFFEASVGDPLLTESMARVIPKAKILKRQDLRNPTRDFDLKTKHGWDRAKILAKSRTIMYQHFSPPWTAVRELCIVRDRYGEDDGRTKRIMRSDTFVTELRMALRCVSLCTIRHSIGDFFSMEICWPNPIGETDVWKELSAQPGVFCVTTDEPATDPWRSGGPRVWRRVLLTNVGWMATLTKDSRHAHEEETLAWDWRVQPTTVPTCGAAYALKVAQCFKQFLELSLIHI